MYNRDEHDDPYNRDHITEAYGPTAADAAIFGLEDVRAEAEKVGDTAMVKMVNAEIEALRRRWGLTTETETPKSWLYDLI